MIDLLENIEQIRKEWEPRTPAGTLRDFRSSTIWSDMKFEIYGMLLDLWELLEHEREPVQAAEHRGSIEALRKMLDILDNLEARAEESNDSERE
jgi:hypothetical protein